MGSISCQKSPLFTSAFVAFAIPHLFRFHSLALTDCTGVGKITGTTTESFFDDERGVFHIISPGSCLCAPGSKKNQHSLAHSLAVETNPLLTEVLAQEKHVKVIFINGRESVRAKQQKKYEQVTCVWA